MGNFVELRADELLELLDNIYLPEPLYNCLEQAAKDAIETGTEIRIIVAVQP